MLVKVVVTIFMCFVLYFQSKSLLMLLTATRTEGKIEELRTGSKGRRYATVSFTAADGKPYGAVISSVEGRPSVGGKMKLMYDPHDPAGTATLYSPSLYVLPFFIYPGALGILAFMWVYHGRKAKPASKSEPAKTEA